MSKLAKFIINSEFVEKRARFIGEWMSAHRKFLRIEYDSEWNTWRTKAEDDAHWDRKLSVDIRRS